jgi:hypothetical protein
MQKQSRFFREVTRLAVKQGFQTSGITDEGSLELSSGQRYLCRIDEQGSVFYPRENAAELQSFFPQVNAARSYVTAMEQASPLHAEGLGEGYVTLAAFENTVLAGKDRGDHGFQFVTWEWGFDRTGLNHGHYYEDYAVAKEDFAFRSGLAPEHCHFSPEQAAALHGAICMALDEGFMQDAQESRCLEQCREKLQAAYPALAEQTMTSDQRFEPTMSL